jgi:hypothetical protein
LWALDCHQQLVVILGAQVRFPAHGLGSLDVTCTASSSDGQ